MVRALHGESVQWRTRRAVDRTGIPRRADLQAVNEGQQGVASDPIVFSVPVVTQAKAKVTAHAAEPVGLAVNEEAMAAATDGGKSRTKENRLPTLT